MSEVERKLLVKQSYLRKIDIELQKEFSDTNELFLLIKGFFSELLKLDYEFTYEELGQELDKAFLKLETRQKIDMMLQTLTELTYFKSTELSIPETKSFLKTLREIVDESIIDQSGTAKKSLLEKWFKKESGVNAPQIATITTASSLSRESLAQELSLRGSLSREPLPAELSPLSPLVLPESFSLNPASLPVNPEPLLRDHVLAEEHISKPLQELYLVIEKAYVQLAKKHSNAARKTYLSALDIYRRLSPAEKKSVFFRIHALYEKLNA